MLRRLGGHGFFLGPSIRGPKRESAIWTSRCDPALAMSARQQRDHQRVLRQYLAKQVLEAQSGVPTAWACSEPTPGWADPRKLFLALHLDVATLDVAAPGVAVEAPPMSSTRSCPPVISAPCQRHPGCPYSCGGRPAPGDREWSRGSAVVAGTIFPPRPPSNRGAAG
jgi:hypothetical protein